MAIMQAAAPEVLLAAESDTPVVKADSATDVWALGVLAFELISGSHLFPAGTEQEDIRGAIFGALPMPWEDVPEHRRSPLQALVVRCFAREPAERPRAVTLAAEWRDLVAYGGVDASGDLPGAPTGSSSGSETFSEGGESVDTVRSGESSREFSTLDDTQHYQAKSAMVFRVATGGLHRAGGGHSY